MLWFNVISFGFNVHKIKLSTPNGMLHINDSISSLSLVSTYLFSDSEKTRSSEEATRLVFLGPGRFLALIHLLTQCWDKKPYLLQQILPRVYSVNTKARNVLGISYSYEIYLHSYMICWWSSMPQSWCSHIFSHSWELYNK